MDDLRTLITDMRADMQREFAIVRADMREMRADMTRQFADVNRRFEVLDQKVDRDFRWLVGIHLTVMTAVFGVLLAAVFRQL